jgi:hypothetical protein
MVSLPPHHTGDSASPSPRGTGEDHYVLLVLGDRADCAPLDLLPNVDCEAPPKTLWRAGILGLCDAPYGLGILGPVGRSLRVVRVLAPLPGAPVRPLPAPRAERDVAQASSTPAAPPDRPQVRDTVALCEEGGTRLPAIARLPMMFAETRGLTPGHERQVDRPPRS